MFMFRNKRASLIRRLLRARIINETLSENEELLRTNIISNLQDTQLEKLVDIIENGHDSRTCIPIRKTTTSSSSKNRQSTRLLYRNSNIEASSEEGGGSSSENNCFSCCVASSTPPPNFPSRSGARLARQTPSCTLVETTSSPPPHVLCCQTYRWPELKNFNELKKLPQCSCDYSNNSSSSDKDDDEDDNENVYICCNPYHWSRLCGPESPPPPYRRYPEEKLRPEDRAPSEGKLPPSVSSSSASSASPCGGRRENQGSLPTSGDGGAGRCGGAGEWCKLAYWELQRRVGALFPVCSSTVHVFSSPTQPGCAQASLCLADLGARAGQQLPLPANPTAGQQGASEAVKRTRTKIGLGMLLSQEGDGVWAYNLSEGPMFVNSPTLDEPHSRTLVVYKLPPGSCLRIFDWERATRSKPSLDPACGPVDPHSVRISFAKGWGPKYSRQEVTACPCWLEVLLVPPSR